MADSSEPLLVPIAAEALVVNAAVQNGTAWRRWQMQYGNLDDFASPTPRPFSESTAPALGIHVRWVLPDALTHGSEVAASATATVTDGQVTSIAVQDGGYGYEAPPLVLFTGGGGSGATATATIVDGVVQTITVNEQGTGFSEAPTVSISASPAIAFPLIPNRWLVVRYGPSPTPTSPRPTKTWLVQSDFVDGALGTSPFVNPNPGTPGAIEATRIGSIITPLSAWDGDDGSTAALFLRAVGPGDATFHAYSPGVANVLSFHDDLDGDLARTADFTYLVVGWYSDPSHDPLYGAVTGWTASRMPVRTRWTTTVEWASLLDTLRWDVQATEALGVDALPDTTMYHALISGVAWNNVTAPSWNGNDVKKMTVAIGNTGADALAALVEHNAGGSLGPVEATALEAFQYGELQTLDRPDGDAQLDLAIHKAWFGSSPGGTVWKVSAIEQLTPSGQVPVVATSAPPSLTPEQAEALAELNRAQTALDEALRRLISLQGQLYDAWWKLQRAGRPAVEANAGQYLDDWQTQVIEPLTEAISPTTPESLYLQVVASEATVGQLAANLPAPTDTAAIAAYATSVLGLDPAGYQLKPAAAPRFYHPVDPVILVSGITVSDAQGTMGDTSGLLCRLATQAATGVAVTVDGVTKPVTPATGTVATAIPVSPSNPALRPAVAAGIAALSLEGFFADPANAAPIVTLGLSSTDAAVIEQLAAAMTAGTAETATIDHPLTVATAFANWRWQPFSPLFLEWDVSYFYTAGDATLQTDNRPFAVVATVPPAGTDVGWVFNGVDYDWYGTNPEGATNTERYAGRTFLTPQTMFVLERRLQKYLNDSTNPDLQAVEELIDTIGTWNFLSQRLSGLHDQFIMRALDPTHLPGDAVAARVGNQFSTTPNPEPGDRDISFGEFNPFFFPIRGGFLVIERLEVVDVFGQAIDLMTAGGNIGNGPTWVPIRGRGLIPAASSRLSGTDLYPSQVITLPPRLVQDARLDFRLVSANTDADETGLYVDSNPVCGWVLPNHLDGGLMIFDATGLALGELLILQQTQSGPSVHWLAAPASAAAMSEPSTIPNAHLRQFASALVGLDRTDFADLLAVIDETIWTIDPLGGRDDESMSVLIGRPLALVRARLQFELRANPANNQSWRDTMLGYDSGMTKVDFAVRLGRLDFYNDGLLGYFLGDTYTRFNSVHTPSGFTPGGSTYLTPIGTNGNYVMLPFDAPTYTSQYLTMLVDPRAAIHATTGILPTKALSVPASYFETALKRMAVTFRTGPVLSDASTIRLPYPAERHGTWNWVQHDLATTPNDTLRAIVRADQYARFASSPPRLIEGWLKLDPTDIEG